jgi:hypothetical protein
METEDYGITVLIAVWVGTVGTVVGRRENIREFGGPPGNCGGGWRGKIESLGWSAYQARGTGNNEQVR